LKRIIDRASVHLRQINNFTDDVVLFLDRRTQPIPGPTLIFEQMPGAFRQKPGNMQPKVLNGNGAEELAQAGCVIGVGMRQYNMARTNELRISVA